MNRVLLVWEEVPEETKMYYFDDLSAEEYKTMTECQNVMVNQSNLTGQQEDALNWLNDWLLGKENDRVNLRAPFTIQDIDSLTVIFSGFIC